MDFILDISNFLLKFLHVISAIAWIGASFYFVMLDNSLSPASKQSDKEKGIHGELWAVHGGGFYHSQKYLKGPLTQPLSDNLHWSKWEAYTTWISGFLLFALMYWGSAQIYLIDVNVADISKAMAISISALFIFGGVIFYHIICNLFYKSHPKILLLLITAFLITEAVLVCQLFSGRGAFIVFGATLASIMAANVFLVIIPGQKKMVHAIKNGLYVDPNPGIQAKVRSMHNTYFTLPVIFCMISNHYSMFYNNDFNWLILILISFAGALIRIYFVSRHQSSTPSFYPIVFAVYCLLMIGFLIKPTAIETVESNEIITSDTVNNIIQTRCSSCHAHTPTQPGITSAPQGIVFENYEQIKNQSTLIYQQSVLTNTMPIGNLTNMTDQERSQLKTWYNDL